MKKSMFLYAAGMMAAFGMFLPSTTVSAADTAEEKPAYIRNSDKIILDEEGRAFCLDGTERITGRFAMEPDFLMGDVNNDEKIDASDAAVLLMAVADAGASGGRAEKYLCSDHYFTDMDTALFFSDADENGVIDASDAAVILQYCAEKGANPSSHTLGYAEYLADEEGFLQKGFIHDGDMTYYADDSYRLCYEWLSLDGKRYYLNQKGALQPESWVYDNGTFYYMQADGSMLCDAWLEDDGKTFYFGSNGAAVRGLTEIDGVEYYFTFDGMVTGWTQLFGGTYYFNENGILQTGWLTLGEETFYLGEDGKRQTGLLSIDENSYYFYPESGCMARGFTVTGETIRYFDENGIMLTGWFTSDGMTHYSLADGTSCIGLQTIDGNVYYFTSENRGMAVSTWLELEDGWRYFDDNGISVRGLQEIGNARYYLNENGIRQTGWQAVEENTYYFGDDGISVTGWQDIGSDQYYFDFNGIMLTDQEMDNMYLGSDGKAVTLLYHQNQLKAQAALSQYGTSVDNIFSFVRATTRYKKTEATKTLAQIEDLGWLYFVDYSMKNYYGVCYYLTAKMDFVLTEAGYECRIVHATHGSGDHYWNQININGTWVNYDCTNNLSNRTWDQMVAYGNYIFLDYVRPEYK